MGYPRKGFKIDVDKLNVLLSCSGKSKARMCREMGYCESALGSAIKIGTMTDTMADKLKETFNIDRSAYEFVDQQDSAIKSENVNLNDYSKLIELLLSDQVTQKFYQLMYSAMYEAVKKAWSE